MGRLGTLRPLLLLCFVGVTGLSLVHRPPPDQRVAADTDQGQAYSCVSEDQVIQLELTITDTPGGHSEPEMALDAFLNERRAPVRTDRYERRLAVKPGTTSSTSELGEDAPDDIWTYQFISEGSRLAAEASVALIGDSFHVIVAEGCQAELNDPEELRVKIEAARKAAEAEESDRSQEAVDP